MPESKADGMSEATDPTAVAPATTYARWSAVAQALAETLSNCSVCLQARLTRDVQHEDWQIVLDGVHRGVTEAFMFTQQHASLTESGATTAAKTAGEAASATAMRVFDHPLAQLGRAYAAAFEAVGLACLLLGNRPIAEIPPSAREFIELSRRAAQALVQGLDLAFGRRRLGSVAQICEHIGALENQADALFRNATAALLGPRTRARGQRTQVAVKTEAEEGTGEVRTGLETVGLEEMDELEEQWTAQCAATLRLLVALEMLTDRCEDVADALLLVERL